MKKRKEVKLGDKVKDPISGVEGIAVGITTFITGCKRVTVQPSIKTGEKSGSPESETFDEPILKIVKRKAIDVPNRDKTDEEIAENTGGPALYKVSKN